MISAGQRLRFDGGYELSLLDVDLMFVVSRPSGWMDGMGESLDSLFCTTERRGKRGSRGKANGWTFEFDEPISEN